MRRRLATLAGLGAVLSATLLWLIAAPGVSAGDPCYHDYEIPVSTSSSATTVSLEPCAFAPTLTSVPVGAMVTFKNASPFTHLITGANQAWGSRDAEIGPGATATYSFAKAGIYPYACALHRGMSGVVVVGDATAISAAALGSTSGTNTPTSPTTTPVPASTPTDPWLLVAGAALVGLVLGAVGGSLASRRRPVREESVVAPAG